MLEVGWQSLIEPPRQHKEPEELPGYVHMRFRVAKKVQTAFLLVTMRFNVTPHDGMTLASLLFLIVAEGSLPERKRRLNELNEKIGKANRCLDQGLRHLEGRAASRNSHGENLEDDERFSVESGDIFGRKLTTPGWDASEEEYWMQQANPFVNFIHDLAKEFPKNSVESYDEERIDDYRIAGDTLRECTGISEKDDQGEELLDHIWNGYIDLATRLRVKRDRDEAGYRQ